MNCQNCKSSRVLQARGKVSDMYHHALNDVEHDGYVPDDLGVGGGNYLEFDVCLDCGQMQGKWPLPKSECEREADQNSKNPFKRDDYVEFEEDDELWIAQILEYSGDSEEGSMKILGQWKDPPPRSRRSGLTDCRRTGKIIRFYDPDMILFKKTDKEW